MTVTTATSTTPPEILPPASAYPPAPIDIKINDAILGTVVTMNEWIGNELSRLQNNVRPRHCEHYSELVALIEEPKLFESLKVVAAAAAAAQPPLSSSDPTSFLPSFIQEDQDDMDIQSDDYEDVYDEEEEDENEIDDYMGEGDEDIIQQYDGKEEKEAKTYTMQYDVHLHASDNGIPGSNTSTTFNNKKDNHFKSPFNKTKTTTAATIKKHTIKPLPPTWLCRVFIEIMRYCGSKASSCSALIDTATTKTPPPSINNAPRLLLSEFDQLRLHVKLGKSINADAFRDKLLPILFGQVQMTEQLVKCWKLMCEWVTRPPFNNPHSAMKWIEMSLGAYIAAQRWVVHELSVLKRNHDGQVAAAAAAAAATATAATAGRQEEQVVLDPIVI